MRPAASNLARSPGVRGVGWRSDTRPSCPGAGALAHTLGAIVADILPLLFLLLVFVLAFCFATMLLIMQEETDDKDHSNPWHNPFDAFLTMLNIGLMGAVIQKKW